MSSKSDFYPSAALNCAITSTAGSFDPQLPLGREAGTARHSTSEDLVPPGIMMLEGGKMRLNFMAAGAQSVAAEVHRQRYELEKTQGGLWTTVVDGGEGGFCPVMFFVDGVEVLNPLAPVGFGASRPINYADIPQEEDDFFLCKDVPHGSVTQEFYNAKTTGTVKSCLVYTPAGYMKESSGQYPVLYLQHGHGENEQCWVHQGKANFILDNLIAQGKMTPCVVVMNNGMVQKEQDGLRVLDVERIEQLLLADCIPFIESRYRVKTGKWSRAMAGLSMGSMQTSAVTLSHPDMFGYAGVFSGFVSPRKGRFEGCDFLKALDDKESFQREYKVFFRGCGREDLVAIESFQADSAMFAEKSLAPSECPVHVEKLYHGEHEWNVWRKCLRDFAQLIFK